MTPSALLELLAEVERGATTPEAAASRLATLPFENLGHTRVDHHRSLRAGLPEVVFAAGKTLEQTVEIFSSLAADGVDVLVTRADAAAAAAVLARYPAAVHNPVARTIALRQSPQTTAAQGHIAVVCAGTSDIPVAEEAAVTAETFGVASVVYTTWVLPDFTACWRCRKISRPRMRSLSAPGWRAPCLRWWAAWFRCQ